MNKSIIASCLLLAISTAALAQTTPGDRPEPKQTVDGHVHLVYFNDTFEKMSIDIQHLADAYSTNQMIYKNDKASLENERQKQKQ